MAHLESFRALTVDARSAYGRIVQHAEDDLRRGSITVEQEGGARQMLDLAHLADRHIRPGWVRTIHSAQGATADRVMAHMESFRALTVDARSAYVAISRARTTATIYTEDRAKLVDAIGDRDGARIGAIDEPLTRYGPGTVLDGPGPEMTS